MRGQKNHLLIFDSIWSQKKKEFEKFQTHFKSIGSALPLDVSQILLPQTQGYKIAFEGGTLFEAMNLPGKYHFTVFANNFDMVEIPTFLCIE